MKKTIRIEAVVETGKETSFRVSYDGESNVTCDNMNSFKLRTRCSLEETLELGAGRMARLTSDLPPKGDLPTFPKGTMGLIIRLVHSRVEGPPMTFQVNGQEVQGEREHSIAHFKIGTYPIIPIDVRMLEPNG